MNEWMKEGRKEKENMVYILLKGFNIHSFYYPWEVRENNPHGYNVTAICIVDITPGVSSSAGSLKTIRNCLQTSLLPLKHYLEFIQ